MAYDAYYREAVIYLRQVQDAFLSGLTPYQQILAKMWHDENSYPSSMSYDGPEWFSLSTMGGWGDLSVQEHDVTGAS
eukprot:CAMPEP_0170480534 /NCGR_PEP_ID=MMETSP0208-20121228/1337_1 /TAXON_ID=197538 /ORGANISM="Strombidium inclinatum, Strain S3" /LENGTH=76 /DNA_ID=CAMNT_0010753097 /DNA_START=677 /DNA_END=907 /DNA_ORIENTATION=-